MSDPGNRVSAMRTLNDLASDAAARWRTAAIAACVLVAAAVYRFLALKGFPNDQYEHLAGAQQMLFGEWPSVDFLDPGMPLTYAASAAAQILFGRTLLAEALLDSSMLGLAAACTFIGAYRLSRSLVVALVVATLSVLIFPRPYAYPKLLTTAVGPLAIWAWTSRPTLQRMAWLAATTVVAFLFRHDYAGYIGIGALAAFVVTPANGWQQIVRRVATFGALLALLLTPYAFFLGGYDAFLESVRSFVTYGSRHSSRTALDLRDLGSIQEAGLFFGYYAVLAVALVWLVVDAVRDGGEARDRAIVAPLLALTLAANLLLISDPLSARLADAVVPNMLTFAWVAGRALRAPAAPVRWVAVGAVAIALTLACGAVMEIGYTPEQLRRTGLRNRGIRALPVLLTERAGELTDRFSLQQMPDGWFAQVFPFFEYLDRCTTPRHRLFFAGYGPQYFVYARRMFAGGQKVFLGGSFASTADQELIVDRMNRQVVLFALLHSDEVEQWRISFPLVAGFMDSHFTPMADIPARPERNVRILVNPAVPPLGTDVATGWPCYR